MVALAGRVTPSVLAVATLATSCVDAGASVVPSGSDAVPGSALLTSAMNAAPALWLRSAAPGQRPDDAVHGESPAGLEAAHGGFRFRPEDAVDFDRAERLLQQLHLPAFAAGAENDDVFGAGRRSGARRRGARRLAAGEARGRADRQGGERAERHAFGARATGHEALFLCATAGAGTPERQLPGLLVGEVARQAQRSTCVEQRRKRGARVSASARSRAGGAPATGQRALERCAPMVGNSKITRVTRHPEASFLHCFAPTGLAVGLA